MSALKVQLAAGRGCFGRKLKLELITKMPKGRPLHSLSQIVEHKSVSAPSQADSATARAWKLVCLPRTPRQCLQCLKNRNRAFDAKNGRVIIQKPGPPVGQFGERVLIVSLRPPCGRIKEGDDATLHQGDKGHRTPEKLLDSPRRSKTERAIRINVVISVPRNPTPCFEHFRNAVRRTQRHFDANRVAIFDT